MNTDSILDAEGAQAVELLQLLNHLLPVRHPALVANPRPKYFLPPVHLLRSMQDRPAHYHRYCPLLRITVVIEE